LVNLSTSPTLPFSKSLRAASTAAHGTAEQASYLASLLGGELDIPGFARLVSQHLHIYRALEGAADGLAGDPVAARFVFEELRRLPSLEADLEALLGSGWRDQAVALPSTHAYCERIREVGATWVGGFVAHHYVRYLGDLSGGIFIGRKVEEIYDIQDHRGTSFYVFDGIPDPMAFKDRYRGLLDTAPWDDAERSRITAEILEGYRFNTEILEQLGA
jgi:heme oxygenase